MDTLNEKNGKELFDAHFFDLPNQGNIYTYSRLQLTNGSEKHLFATIKNSVFTFYFEKYEDTSEIKPILKEIPFKYIPSGAEIVSIDAFNRSDSYDNFVIGLTIIKQSGETDYVSFLNIYYEQNIHEDHVLNLDIISKNCLMLELPFIPYQLFHSKLLLNGEEQIIWLLSGSDFKIHFYKEDPSKNIYDESYVLEQHFPEFNDLTSVVLWADIAYTSDNKRRLTGFGTESGLLKFYILDSLTNSILRVFIHQYQYPICCVRIISLHPINLFKNRFTKVYCQYTGVDLNIIDEWTTFHLIVGNSLEPCRVYKNILKSGLDDCDELTEPEQYDTTICLNVGDIFMDGKMEILIGTYNKHLLVYSYNGQKWNLAFTKLIPHPIHSIGYSDISGEGVNDLIVITSFGVHIIQHNPKILIQKYKQRLKEIPSILMDQFTKLMNMPNDRMEEINYIKAQAPFKNEQKTVKKTGKLM